jgi:DNA-binding transcriptional LysR family regulator
MNLRALRVLIGVMDEGTLSRAAQKMHLSQSAASRLLSLLEAELGTTLFERERRMLIPTPQAEALYPEAQRILSQVAALPRVVEADGTIPLRVMCQTRLVAGLAVPALAQLARNMPSISVHLEAASRRNLVRHIETGRHDLTIATLPLAAPGRAIKHVGSVRLGILLARDHPLSGRATLDIADLADVPYIALDETTVIRRLVADRLAAEGVDLRPTHQTSTGSAAYRLVSEGLGFTFADQIALDPELRTRTVLVPWRQKVTVGIACLQFSETDSRTDDLIRLVENLIAAANESASIS